MFLFKYILLPLCIVEFCVYIRKTIPKFDVLNIYSILDPAWTNPAVNEPVRSDPSWSNVSKDAPVAPWLMGRSVNMLGTREMVTSPIGMAYLKMASDFHVIWGCS